MCSGLTRRAPQGLRGQTRAVRRIGPGTAQDDVEVFGGLPIQIDRFGRDLAVLSVFGFGVRRVDAPVQLRGCAVVPQFTAVPRADAMLMVRLGLPAATTLLEASRMVLRKVA